MPRAKRPLAEADPNASAPAPKRSVPESIGKVNEDYSKKTVAELASLCKEHKLRVGGKKDELVARLVGFDAVNVAPTSTTSKAGCSSTLMLSIANESRSRERLTLPVLLNLWNSRQSVSLGNARQRLKTMRMITRRVSPNARMKSGTRLIASAISRLPSTPIGSGSSVRQEMIVARTLPRKSISVTRTHTTNTTTMITTGMGNRRLSITR
jgi:hypothetical protein